MPKVQLVVGMVSFDVAFRVVIDGVETQTLSLSEVSGGKVPLTQATEDGMHAALATINEAADRLREQLPEQDGEQLPKSGSEGT